MRIARMISCLVELRGYNDLMTSKRRYIFPAIAIFALISVFLSPSVAANQTSAADFWTADKIKKAEVFDMVFDADSKVGKRVTIKATGKRAGGGGGTSVLGASWTNGGLPLTASGKVFFAIGTSYYQCSGALVTDGSALKSIVLTAGHCVFDNATSSYVTNFIFIPSYDIDAVTISGCSVSVNCWSAKGLEAHSGFTSQTSFTYQATWYDWGFATIDELKGGVLPDGDGTNSFPLLISQLSKSTVVNAFGYPAGGKYSPGKDLVYSSGPIGYDKRNGDKTYSLGSDMTGGASGGPWLSSMASVSPYSGNLSSVNSYKYGNTPNSMYGPKFNGSTNDTYVLALAK